ncbi:MAG TPA: hypothetical protein VE991_05750 [Acidimicrobiales bacterium]|nr:hypothetical protein [Acidimicrobiales bacterium]
MPTTSASSPSPGATATSLPERSVRVPVVVCATTFGVTDTTTTTTAPATAAVSLPAVLTGHVALYRDSRDLVQVLAPVGWQCRAGYGADGSGGVQVFPPGATAPAVGVGSSGTAQPFTPSSAQGVVATQTSGCSGCAEGQACPLFATAGQDMENDLGRGCAGLKPDAETVDSLSPTAVQFQDPPGTAGDGVPSGGPYVARGVMTYRSHDPNGSWLETCTLPSDDAELCAASLQLFFGAYDAR